MRRALPAAVVLWLLVSARVPAQDEVRYYDRDKKTEVSLRGTIEQETPEQIVLKLGSRRVQKIPVADVQDVMYEPPSGVNPLDYRRPGNKEDEARQAAAAGEEDRRQKAVAEALAAYQALLPRLASRQFTQRHVQFRRARFLAWAAEFDPTRAEQAIRTLEQFQREHPRSWQYALSMKVLARLRESQGDAAAAQRVYEAVASRADLPQEIRQEFDLLLVRSLLDHGKHTAAEARLKRLAEGLNRTDPQALRIEVYLAACEAALREAGQAEQRLEAVLAQPAPPEVKALAHNTLADLQRRRGTPAALDAAFWNYLWVDVLYHQDRVQHARALYHLAKLFAQVRKDHARAAQYLERLKDQRFEGVEYRVRAIREGSRVSGIRNAEP